MISVVCFLTFVAAINPYSHLNSMLLYTLLNNNVLILSLLYIYCIQGSCDITQRMNNMDTGTSEFSNVDDPPLSLAETFQFSASMEMTSTEGGLATNNTSVEDEMLSTPDNHGSIPLIQPLSQSPHVPGKIPHAVMTQSKLFAATFTSDDATVTQSPHDVDLAKINDALSQTAASTKETGTSELGHVDNPPLSSAETFQFSASMVTHSTTATDNNDTSANMTSTEGSLATNNTSVEDEMLSTPDNHGSIPMIQPLSQSPHVPGKTPHAVMTQSKLFAATSATDDDATVTQSPCDVDIADDLSQIIDADSATKVGDNVNSVCKADDSPSLKDSRSMGDLPPKLQSTSELPSTAEPILASNIEYPPHGKVVVDEIYGEEDYDDDVFEHDETSPLISKEQHRQPKTRQYLRSRHMLASGCSYNSTEDSKPLLKEEEGDETTSAPITASSWFSNFPVRSVISCLIKIGSGIGSLVLYCISIFRPPAEATNTEPANTRTNHIN